MFKRVQVRAGTVGLVFKKGEYKRVLTEGMHWVGLTEHVVEKSMALQFTAGIANEVLLRDKKLAAMLEVIRVSDGEMVLVFKNGVFVNLLQAGEYMFFKGLIAWSFTRVDKSKIYITESINPILFKNFILSQQIRVFEVAAHEKGLLMVNDEFVKILEGGTYRFWQNEKTVKVLKADMRQVQTEVPGQELLTKDKASIRVNFDITYQVVNIKQALLENSNFTKQLYVMVQLALRKFIGQMTLDELLENKVEVAQEVFEQTKLEAEVLGVTLKQCGMRDVILTGEMKQIMNQVLIAQKKAQANVITRREETASIRSLLNTAKLMEENEMLFKLKEMEFVEQIADKIGEITLTGNGGMLNQLKEIFTAGK